MAEYLLPQDENISLAIADQQFCRSVLELAAPAWTPGLTKTEISQLERVQKTACGIILGGKITSYKSALKILNMETLESRREQISLKFAKRALKSEKGPVQT